MEPDLDQAGQPNPGFNWNRRLDRGMDELIGLVKGILADGVLVIEEAQFVLDWLNQNEPVRRDYSGAQLHRALTAALVDGVLEPDEEDRLVELLLRFTGGKPLTSDACSNSNQLPLDAPPPDVTFASRSFCFTGRFGCGTRRWCESTVCAAHGIVHKYPVLVTDFLVIGDIGSRDWIHSNSGRKIERALEIRAGGQPLKIIAENHWRDSVKGAGIHAVGDLVSPAGDQVGVSTPSVEISDDSASSVLSGQTVVVTGTLEKFERQEIEDLIVKLGGKASGSVSKKTSFVVAGENAGSKLAKAKELGVPILSEADFVKKIEGK